MRCKYTRDVILYLRTMLIKVLFPDRKERDLAELSALGHFLKGSSATLGLTKVKDSCEKIQHYGQKKDEEGTADEPDEAKCLERIEKTLVAVKEEYAEVEKVLKKFYGS
jgi:osomolarity two-component system, phosphorelay intermediate protein YPD1